MTLSLGVPSDKKIIVQCRPCEGVNYSPVRQIFSEIVTVSHFVEFYPSGKVKYRTLGASGAPSYNVVDYSIIRVPSYNVIDHSCSRPK